MTTVIRANGVQFINDNLPSLSPVVSDGLVAMFRPSNKPNGLTDLYNKDNQLTIVGNPELLDIGVKTNIRNYLQSNLPETPNLTFLAVVKKVGRQSAFVVGNYSGGTGTGGSSIWLNDDGQGGYTVRAQSSSYANGQTYNRVFNNIGAYQDEQYMFVGLVVNADANTMQAYNPTLLSNRLSYNNIDVDGLKNRRLNNPLRIGSGLNVGWAGQAVIAEVIIYNKALTEQEVMTQYMYSKDYFKKKHNIDI